MNLLENPFHILELSSRDNRRRIAEQAEDKALNIDSELCNSARADLTNPRKRLAAEVAWLPGATSKNAEAAIALVQESPEAAKSADNLDPLSRSNIIALAIQSVSNPTSDEMSHWLRFMAHHVEQINSNDVLAAINADRSVSGFPQVTDIDLVEDFLNEQRRYYCHVIESVLNTMPPMKLVEAVTNAIEGITQLGEKPAPILLDDLINLYEINAQQFLNKEQENIEQLIDKINKNVANGTPDHLVDADIKKLIAMVRNWDMVAQPIQVCAKSHGSEHRQSAELGRNIRNFAIDLFNKHGKLMFLQELVTMLKDVFAELDGLTERLTQDEKAINHMAHQNRARLSASSTLSESSGQNSSGKKKFIWIVIGIICFIVVILVVRNSGKKPAPAGSAAASAAKIAADAIPKASVSPPSGKLSGQNDYGDIRPAPGGRDRVLNESEIRWCLRAKSDLEFERGTHVNNREIKAFNSRVQDWNSRCGDYSYYKRDMERAERETGIGRND